MIRQDEKSVVCGYFRTGVGGSDCQSDISALLEAGVLSGNLFFDQEGTRERDRMLDMCERGDTVLVFRLSDVCDRIADLFQLVSRLSVSGIQLRSVSEPWFVLKSEKLHGSAMYDVIRELYELSLRMDEISSSDEKGSVPRPVGRPRGISARLRSRLNAALSLYRRQYKMPISEICAKVGINERTFYRYLRREGAPRRSPGRKSMWGEDRSDL